MGTRIVVMRDGVVQQVDTPENIYHHPANQFVATFVGTPAMNILNGTLKRAGDTVSVDLGQGTAVALTPALGRVAEHLTSGAALGIRPEDVYLDRSHTGVPIDAVVSVFEPMGHENMVYLTVGDGQTLIVRVNNTWHGSPGDQVVAMLDPERIHVFDPETEQVLAVG